MGKITRVKLKGKKWQEKSRKILHGKMWCTPRFQSSSSSSFHFSVYFLCGFLLPYTLTSRASPLYPRYMLLIHTPSTSNSHLFGSQLIHTTIGRNNSMNNCIMNGVLSKIYSTCGLRESVIMRTNQLVQKTTISHT